MPLNKRSQLITAGVARSPNRAMLRAVGFGDGDFDKPIVGVANGHSTMNPCNAGIQPLVDRAMAALKTAGAMPQVFGVPTITDGIGMGTEAMKYSLVSREVIADCIETAVNGQAMDGVLVCGGCDKNMPGGMIAMLRMNVPSHLRLRRHHQAGQMERPGSDHRQRIRGGRLLRRRQDEQRGFCRYRKKRLPFGRRLRRHVHREHDVVVVRGAGHERTRFVADGLARSGKSRFGGRFRARAGQRD